VKRESRTRPTENRVPEKVTEMFLLLVFTGLEYVEAMLTEQNSLGLLDAPSDKLLGDANSRMEMSANPRPGRLRDPSPQGPGRL